MTSSSKRYAKLVAFTRILTIKKQSQFYARFPPCLAKKPFTRAFCITAIRQNHAVDKPYEQIPEDLKIHMFTPELDIIKSDELKSPFKNFSADFILQLLEWRSNEIRLEKQNSNPSSRINSGNVVRFMKLAARLKQLFAINGGNTEVLDAVLRSQTTLDAFEAKLKTKKAAREKPVARAQAPQSGELSADLYGPGPYAQIPDSLGLHEFVKELDSFRTKELGCLYKDISASDLLDLLERRVKDVYKAVEDAPEGSAITKKNVIAYFNLLPKLQKLLAWNGGVTDVLDAMIHSQGVFEQVEKSLKAKQKDLLPEHGSSTEISESATYKQVPDDFLLEEFAEELKEIWTRLGTDFCKAPASKILEEISDLSTSHSSPSKRDAYAKLYRNVRMLFKHNRDQTFVLDNVILNSDVFEDVEAKLSKAKESSTASPSKKPPAVSYRESDHVIELLNSYKSHHLTEDSDKRDEEHSIKAILTEAMSKEEKRLLEQNPQEYEEIKNLTAEKIRSRRRNCPTKRTQPLSKKEVKDYLENIKKTKEVEEKTKWREREAYEWSANMYNNQRSLEARNFFDPIMAGKSKIHFPMFPGADERIEYMILTSNGEQFRTSENPLGIRHSPEDMFSILSTLSEAELAKFSRNVEKLRKQGWRVIGSGRGKGMLVLSKHKKSGKTVLTKLAVVSLATSGVCFLTLLLLNLWIDDEVIEQKVSSKEQPHAELTDTFNSDDDIAGPSADPEQNKQSQGGSLKRFLWTR